MSDQSQGPGWWQASDLKWYPPDQVPGTGAGAGAPAPAPWDPPRASWDPPPMAGPPPLGGPASPYVPPSPYGPPPGPSYGTPGYSPYGGYAMGAPGSGLPSVNGMATASLVCGILGLVLFFCFILGLPLAIAGAWLGGVALARINKGTADPGSRGLALGGTICSGLALAAGLLVAILIYAS